MKKVKVFLGGYINYTNAQNLNCRALAEYLDKDKFKIFTLTTHFGKKEQFEVNTFNCFKPFSLSKHLGFLWGIIKCDVAYLPKHVDTPLWVLKLAKFLKKPIFTTIEGNVIDRKKIHNLISLFDSKEDLKYHFSFFNEVYSITEYLLGETKQFLKLENKILALGVSNLDFQLQKKYTELKKIIFIGSLTKNKKVGQLLNLAENYPLLSFIIIGEGIERKRLEEKAQKNVFFMGRLSHKEIKQVFAKSDLFFLPSKSEGFPKVILEAASAGIPSIVYNTYGASDWMENKKNGFIATDLDDVKSIINELLDNLKLLQITSENAVKLAERFDWKNVIKDWEGVIINLSNGK
jgi:glycosyltransferase involved in cell wall biosynthesis